MRSSGPPENSNEIKAYLHCKLCLAEQAGPAGVGESPESYSRLSVGWTRRGFQVWCERHGANVMHVDFEGAQHPANLTCKNATIEPWRRRT